MTVDRRAFLTSGGAAVAGLLVPSVSAQEQPADPVAAAKEFIAAHEAKMKPLDIAAGKAWWNANISGKDEDFAKKEEAQNEIDAALSEPKPFATLKGIKAAADAGKIKDALVARQVELLYLMYLEKQVEPELLKKIT